jgi:cytochrome b561
MSNSEISRYDRPSQFMHWVTALAVVSAFILGPEGFGKLLKSGADPATRLDIVAHETLGLFVLALTLVRLVWVALRPAAPQVAMAPWMRRAGQATHVALWLLLLALPASALLALGSEDHPLTLLGGLRVDHMPLIGQSALAPVADWGEVHGFLGDAIIWLAGLHAAAALLHHLVLKDRVLASMWPWGRAS